MKRFHGPPTFFAKSSTETEEANEENMTKSFSSSAGPLLTTFESNHNEFRFSYSHLREFIGLVGRNLFTLVPINDANEVCIYFFRFISTVKQKWTNNVFEKISLFCSSTKRQDTYTAHLCPHSVALISAYLVGILRNGNYSQII